MRAVALSREQVGCDPVGVIVAWLLLPSIGVVVVPERGPRLVPRSAERMSVECHGAARRTRRRSCTGVLTGEARNRGFGRGHVELVGTCGRCEAQDFPTARRLVGSVEADALLAGRLVVS